MTEEKLDSKELIELFLSKISYRTEKYFEKTNLHKLFLSKRAFLHNETEVFLDAASRKMYIYIFDFWEDKRISELQFRRSFHMHNLHFLKRSGYTSRYKRLTSNLVISFKTHKQHRLIKFDNYEYTELNEVFGGFDYVDRISGPGSIINSVYQELKPSGN